MNFWKLGNTFSWNNPTFYEEVPDLDFRVNPHKMRSRVKAPTELHVCIQTTVIQKALVYAFTTPTQAILG